MMIQYMYKKTIYDYMHKCIHIDCWYAFEYWQNYFQWPAEAAHFASLQLLLKMKNIYFYFSSSFLCGERKGAWEGLFHNAALPFLNMSWPCS